MSTSMKPRFETHFVQTHGDQAFAIRVLWIAPPADVVSVSQATTSVPSFTFQSGRMVKVVATR